MLTISGQKLTKSGKPVIDRSTGLPVYHGSVDKRIKVMKDILYFGLNTNDRKWEEVKQSLRTI